MAVIFISDLHLDAQRPDPIHQFVEFMRRDAPKAECLYILGDLFEAWIGDDDDDPMIEPIIAAIRSLTQGGVPCYFMHGNRDFLVGDGFAQSTGCVLLDEYSVINVHGEPLLLTHGDLLCTDDVRYMKLRRQLRDRQWQQDFLSKSLTERREIARQLRELSQSEMAEKSEDIMDVNLETVRQTMQRFGVKQLLHGHTHRPEIHRFEIDGSPATRVVLGDWYGTGGFVRWRENGPEAKALSY